MPTVGPPHLPSGSAGRSDQTIELARMSDEANSVVHAPAPGGDHAELGVGGPIAAGDAVHPADPVSVEAYFIPMPPPPVMGQVAPAPFQRHTYAADHPVRGFIARNALRTLGGATLFITILTAIITKTSDNVFYDSQLRAVRGDIVPSNVVFPVTLSPRGAPSLANAPASSYFAFGSVTVEEHNLDALETVLAYARKSALVTRAIADLANNPLTTLFTTPMENVHYPPELQAKAEADQIRYVEIADKSELQYVTPAGAGPAASCETISAAAQTVSNILSTHGEMFRPYVSAVFTELPDAVYGSFNQRRLTQLLRQEAPHFNETVGAVPVGAQPAADILTHGPCTTDTQAVRVKIARAAHRNDLNSTDLYRNLTSSDVNGYADTSRRSTGNTHIPNELVDQANDLQIAFAQHALDAGRAALNGAALPALLARDKSLHAAAYRLGLAIDVATNAPHAEYFYPRSVLDANSHALGPVASASAKTPMELFPKGRPLDAGSASPIAPAAAEAPAPQAPPRPLVPRPPIVRP